MSELVINRVHTNYVTVKRAENHVILRKSADVGVSPIPLCTHCFRMYHTNRDLLDHQKKCLTKKRKLLFTAL